MTPEIALTRTAEADPAVPLPSYATPGAAGADVRANLGTSMRVHGMTIEPGGRALVPTGLHAAIPPGFEIQIRTRSGLALKQGLSVANSPGTIDSDYRGPLGVIAINSDPRRSQSPTATASHNWSWHQWCRPGFPWPTRWTTRTGGRTVSARPEWAELWAPC